jgi:hypothetical protein
MFRAMRGMQGTSERVRVERFRALSVRMGVAGDTHNERRRRDGNTLLGLIRGKGN